MLTIAVTGGLCSGKSFAAARLAGKTGMHIDSDTLVRELYDRPGSVTRKIARLLGPRALGRDGRPDRKAIAHIIFSDRAARAKLEKLVHPLVFSGIRARVRSLKKSGPGLIAVEIPLLGQVRTPIRFDAVLLVSCRRQTQIERARARGIAPQLARKILASQMRWEEKVKIADYVVENNGTRRAFAKTLDALKRALNARKETLPGKPR